MDPPPHRFSKRLHIKDQALACKQLWVSYLLSITKELLLWQQLFHNMSAILAAVLDFSKIFVLRKNAANFTEISIKHVFADSNRNIIGNRVKKKKLEQVIPKIYSFLFRTLICIINYA